jgi:hypothetical protein
MPSTYEPIATSTLGSAAADVTFSSISGSYTDLIVVMQTQSTAAGFANLNIQFNGDAGTTYSRTILYGNGTTAGSGRSSNANEITVNTMPTSGQGFWTIVKLSIMNYSNTTTYKTVLNRADLLNDAALASVSMWRSTSAITSIKIYSSSGNLNTGSTFTLYGVKSA